MCANFTCLHLGKLFEQVRDSRVVTNREGDGFRLVYRSGHGYGNNTYHGESCSCCQPNGIPPAPPSVQHIDITLYQSTVYTHNHGTHKQTHTIERRATADLLVCFHSGVVLREILHSRRCWNSHKAFSTLAVARAIISLSRTARAVAVQQLWRSKYPSKTPSFQTAV
jgi:hypothetical protein